MTTRDPLDVSLHDAELYEELQLATRVIIAASESGEEGPPLTTEQIDEVLGVHRGIPQEDGPARPVENGPSFRTR